jgi:hypothetical protein
MSVPPRANPMTQGAAGSREATSPDARMDPAPRGDRRRLAQSLVQAAIATLVMAVVLGGILWSRTTTTHVTSDRKQQRPDDVHVGQVVVGQGSGNCRTLSFDNSTGAFKDGAPEPCAAGQSAPPHGFQRGRFEAVKRQFSKPAD